MTTDPTPRTAATARERLGAHHAETHPEPWDDCNVKGAHDFAAKELLARLLRLGVNPSDWRVIARALAATAEAPGRVAALEAALETLADAAENASEHVHERANWSAAALLAGIRMARLALAAPASPAGVSGDGCPLCGDGHKHPEPKWAGPAPASTPSEPVERWSLVPGEDDDCPRCGRAKVRVVQPEYEPGGALCDECGWDSRTTTPATRDE